MDASASHYRRCCHPSPSLTRIQDSTLLTKSYLCTPNASVTTLLHHELEEISHEEPRLSPHLALGRPMASDKRPMVSSIPQAPSKRQKGLEDDDQASGQTKHLPTPSPHSNLSRYEVAFASGRLPQDLAEKWSVPVVPEDQLVTVYAHVVSRAESSWTRRHLSIAAFLFAGLGTDFQIRRSRVRLQGVDQLIRRTFRLAMLLGLIDGNSSDLASMRDPCQPWDYRRPCRSLAKSGIQLEFFRYTVMGEDGLIKETGHQGFEWFIWTWQSKGQPDLNIDNAWVRATILVDKDEVFRTIDVRPRVADNEQTGA